LAAKEYNMKRFILTTVAVALATVFGFTSSADAGPHKAPIHVAGHVHVSPHVHVGFGYHVHPGHVHVHVRGYHGWIARCWFPSFRCYAYFCPTDQAWYYWYAPFDQYLPISYMAIYPPTDGVVPVAVVPAVPVVPVTPGLPLTAPVMPALPAGATLVPGPITAP
jgi:hypothetical protein